MIVIKLLEIRSIRTRIDLNRHSQNQKYQSYPVMSFITSNIVYVINVIEDIIATSKSQNPLNFSTGHCDENSKKFMKLSFPLENGTAEIKI